MIAQTTPTGRAAVALVIEQDYRLGDVKHCVLLRRGFNHVYGLEFVDGRRAAPKHRQLP